MHEALQSQVQLFSDIVKEQDFGMSITLHGGCPEYAVNVFCCEQADTRTQPVLAAGVQKQAELAEEQRNLRLKHNIQFFQRERQLRQAVVEQEKERFSQQVLHAQPPHAQDALLTKQQRLSRHMQGHWTSVVEQLEGKLQRTVESIGACTNQERPSCQPSGHPQDTADPGEEERADLPSAAQGHQQGPCEEAARAAGYDGSPHTQVRQQIIVTRQNVYYTAPDLSISVWRYIFELYPGLALTHFMLQTYI